MSGYMSSKDFNEVVKVIVKNDRRYDIGAYHFVRRALDFTLKKMKDRRTTAEGSHVSGRELLEGIREYALDQYGPMTKTLFEEWGLRQTGDFGEIVFNLIDYGLFGKTESDSREDFCNLYDFDSAFAKPFQPRQNHLQVPSSHRLHQRTDNEIHQENN